MSRLALLLILGLWLIAAESIRNPTPVHRPALAVFLASYLLLVLGVAVWARLLSRQLLTTNLHKTLRRFNRMTRLVRWAIPLWFLFGLFGGAAWAQVVLSLTGTKLQLPGLLLGTLPALLAWVGLWWAEFPADRALREQGLLGELAANLPLHMPPSLARHFRTTLRQQLLPVLLPVLLIILLRDLIMLVAGQHISPAQSDLAMVPAALGVYLASPEILRRVFNARSLDDSPLRRRLETICRRSRLRYRDILLWQTDYSAANAAVIGILPGLRYVLLSDRLLETMTDEQIEAVFAHELGHIVHHHMLWFVLFFATLTLAALGPGQLLDNWFGTHLPARFHADQYETARNVLGGGGVFLGMMVLFGMLSRRFERQADVFAARMMQSDWGVGETRGPVRGFGHRRFHVGQRGAAIFNAALHRVAIVNNIPIRAKDWFHPSIARRLWHLEQLSTDPAKTRQFDRRMSWLYLALLLALLICGVIAFLVQ